MHLSAMIQHLDYASEPQSLKQIPNPYPLNPTCEGSGARTLNPAISMGGYLGDHMNPKRVSGSCTLLGRRVDRVYEAGYILLFLVSVCKAPF